MQSGIMLRCKYARQPRYDNGQGRGSRTYRVLVYGAPIEFIPLPRELGLFLDMPASFFCTFPTNYRAAQIDLGFSRDINIHQRI